MAGKYEFKVIHAGPGTINLDDKILTVFAQLDVVIGEGVDILINLSLSNPQINLEQDRSNSQQPGNAFAFMFSFLQHLREINISNTLLKLNVFTVFIILNRL